MHTVARTFLVYIAGVLTAVIIFLFSIEMYWPFSPLIDTKFSSGFSEEKFQSLKLGASTTEVISTLGEPLWKEGCGGCWEPASFKNAKGQLPSEWLCTEPCSPQIDHDLIWQYSDDGACTWWDFAWKYYALHIRNGVVIAKSSFWQGN